MKRSEYYIDMLDITTKNMIVEELIELGLSSEEIMEAMSSRLCDLEDIIDIEKYLN